MAARDGSTYSGTFIIKASNVDASGQWGKVGRFVISCLKLRRRQKIGLVGIFSLGLITICISLARFVAYTATDYSIDDADGSMYPDPPSPLLLTPASQASSSHTLTCYTDAWCTAEMCTAVIVASLPGLKHLIVRGGTPSNTHYNHGTHGYVQKKPGHPVSTSGTSHTRIKGGRSEDELELVFLIESHFQVRSERERKMAKML